MYNYLIVPIIIFEQYLYKSVNLNEHMHVK